MMLSLLVLLSSRVASSEDKGGKRDAGKPFDLQGFIHGKLDAGSNPFPGNLVA